MAERRARSLRSSRTHVAPESDAEPQSKRRRAARARAASPQPEDLCGLDEAALRACVSSWSKEQLLAAIDHYGSRTFGTHMVYSGSIPRVLIDHLVLGQAAAGPPDEGNGDAKRLPPTHTSGISQR